MTKSHRLTFRSEWLFLTKCILLFALLKCPLRVQHSIFMVLLCLWPLFLTYRLMLAALVVLIMIVISNFSALFFCCYATDHFGLWLKTYHRKDMACLRILVILHSIHHTPDGKKKVPQKSHIKKHTVSPVNNIFYVPTCDIISVPTWTYVQVQNGLALYTTWTSVASLINFSLVLHLWGVERNTAATASLCILFGEVIGW